MPRSEEHIDKYISNKKILDELFECGNKEHSDWIAIICFYSAMHIIEAEFARSTPEAVHNRTHKQRESRLLTSKEFDSKIVFMYKQLSTNSRIARYEAGHISPTIANSMINYLSKIEKAYS